MYLYARNSLTTPNLKYAGNELLRHHDVQNLKKVLKSKIFNFFLIPEAQNMS